MKKDIAFHDTFFWYLIFSSKYDAYEWIGDFKPVAASFSCLKFSFMNKLACSLLNHSMTI